MRRGTEAQSPMQSYPASAPASYSPLSLTAPPSASPPPALALVFSLKISVNPESILSSCFNDRLVTKGTMLEVLTVFFQVCCVC